MTEDLTGINFNDPKHIIKEHDPVNIASHKEHILATATSQLLTLENRVLDMPVNSQHNYQVKNNRLTKLQKKFMMIALDYNMVDCDSYALADGEYQFLKQITNRPVLVANVRHDMTVDTIPLNEPKFSI